MKAVTDSKEFAWAGLVIALAGLLSRPEILNLFDVKWADTLTALGIIIQTFSKALIGEE